MAKLVWDNKTEGLYNSGVSKGVFFGSDGVGHAWSGLISVSEKPQANEPTAVYNSLGEKYDIHGNKAEKKHGLSCYTYPEVMESYLGFEFLDDYGYRVDERSPKKFSMAYRVELGNGLYEIHVLLNQIASLGELTRQTQSANVGLSTVTMTLEGVPDPKFKTSHVILDSRLPITKSAERLLFGSEYTDSNINDFLTAEPVWETVATNYAPIIEPDYDNYVWLGKPNLIKSNTMLFETDNQTTNVVYNTSYIDSTIINNPDAYLMTNLGFTKDLVLGVTYTMTVKAVLPPGRDALMLYDARVIEGGSSKNTYMGVLTSIGENLYSLTFTYPESIDGDTAVSFVSNYLRLYGARSQKDATDNPGDLYIQWVKLEEGSVATPWIPAPSDPDQNPRPTDPYPENYKPGVKYGERWDHRAQATREVIAFYDERTGGVGAYSFAESDSGVKALILSPYSREIHQGSTVKFESEVIIHDPMSSANSLLGRIRIPSTPTSETSTPIPNVRGTHKVYVEKSNYATDRGAIGRVFAYRGGFAGEPYITYKNWLATTSGYNGGYFDANTKPATRGDRYRRVETPNGDYTVHEQLRLRSTTKVTLRDITQYEYWIDAADTMLLLQNEIFTFSGPQAVITDDTFTIDDSIVGFASDTSE